MSKFTLLQTGQAELSPSPLKIAVEGCGHGQLDIIYDSLEATCQSRSWAVADLDFLIICGDFQAVRNERDLNCMSVPKRHRKLGDFHKYYSGEKRAPVLTLVIGGNHEASSYFSELHYGGWLAPNIYYLGAANVVRYGPLRIAGLSGIFKSEDYPKPHHERLPYTQSDIRSIYHVRECDISRLLQIQSPVDIALSHDWPRRIEWFGDYQQLFTRRPQFLDSAKIDRFGSPASEQLLYYLRPKHWFAGHMHIKFSAVVEHKGHMVGDIFRGLAVSDELRAQLPPSMFKAWPGDKKSICKTSPSAITNTVTHFLGLSKPGPESEFLELVEVSPCYKAGDTSTKPYMQKTPEGKFSLYYDEEWLSILRCSSGSGKSEDDSLNRTFGASDSTSTNLDPNLNWIQANITGKGLLKIPENFKRHAPVYDPNEEVKPNEQPCEYPNSQTESFCSMLEIRDQFSISEGEAESADYIVFG